jgi:lysozyme family protein
MASFAPAHDKVKIQEGGYASAADAAKIQDKGGETYKGHARNYSADWAGWKIIDAYKAKFGLPKWNSVITSAKEPYPGAAAELDRLVAQRYKSNFWDVIKGDYIKDQAVANLMFDIAVNSGPGTAAKSIQRVLKVTVDGAIGPNTLKAINAQNPATLLHQLGEYRIEWLRKYQSGKKYLDTLLNRVNSYLTEYKKPVAGLGIIVVLGAGLFFLVNQNK